MSPARRQDTPQPDAEAVYKVIANYKRSEPEVAEQLEAFFDLFRGLGVPMTFSPLSLVALDEAFPALIEQIEQEVGKGTEAEGENLMYMIQLAGFWYGTLIVEELGGTWNHGDDDEGSVIDNAREQDGPLDPFEPFIEKARNPKYSLVKEFEKRIGRGLLEEE
ncbi:MAG: hypothetical protein ABI743_15060 [bacterium]